MQTLTTECDVTTERTLTVHLPATVGPGRHRIALVTDPPEPIRAADEPTPLQDDDPPRTPLYARLSELRDAAVLAGELPAPMT